MFSRDRQGARVGHPEEDLPRRRGGRGERAERRILANDCDRAGGEARVTASIESEYVCKLLGHKRDPSGAHLLIFEKLDGETLSERLKRELYLPFGEVGQVRFRASSFPTAASCIPGAASKVFQGGWYYPGDLAMINDECYLFLRGRDDDVINHDGARFYPLEVENVLVGHAAVVEAAVVGRYYNDDKQVAVAFVVLSDYRAVRELKQHCDSRLASHKTPMHIEVVGELPKDPLGEVSKQELKERFQKTYMLTREDARWSEDTN